MITNFDLVKLDTHTTHLLGDSRQSTKSQIEREEVKVNTPSLVTMEATDDTSSITTNTRDIQENIEDRRNATNELQAEDLTKYETNKDLLKSTLNDSKSK